MAEVGTAFVSVIPSAKGFGKSLDSQVGGDVDRSGKSVGKRFGTAMKVGALAVLGAAAIGAKFLGDAVGEAREAQKVGALTTSTIKATGGAAKVTAQQVGDLANAISRKTGIDDETIQSGQNMLLTFKNIRNEVGKGNDIFNQSSKALIDMAAAMGTEPKQAAIQLGKALNDPVKGVTALGRAGVQFSESQKAVIKRMVETGNTLGAQKVILKELNSQFGGAAAAQATAADKARVAWANLKEQIGTALLPVVDRLANWMTTKVIPAVSKFFSEMQSGTGTGGRVVTVLRAVGDAARVVGRWIGGAVAFVRDLSNRFRDAMGGGAGFRKSMADLEPFVRLVRAAVGALGDGLVWTGKHAVPIVVGSLKALAVTLGVAARAAIWLWNNGFGPMLKFVLGGIGTLMQLWGKMLKLLGRVPGFGWAAKAGRDMDSAGNKAVDMANSIKRIPDKKTSKITADTSDARARILDLSRLMDLQLQRTRVVNIRKGGGLNIAGAKAAGGPVAGGKTYLVGERGPELFTSSQSGRIIPNHKLGTAAGGAGVVQHIYETTDPRATAAESARRLAWAGAS